MKWKDKLLKEFIYQLNSSNEDWDSTINQIVRSDGAIGIHIAVFNEPFLSAVIQGKKLVESRFSLIRVNPFRKVYKGDIVLIKKTAGNVLGFFFCGNIEYWVLNSKSSLKELELKYSTAICSNLDPKFWESREHSRYATLIEIQEIHILKSFGIGKKDRTSWTVIKEKYKPLIFGNLIKNNE